VGGWRGSRPFEARACPNFGCSPCDTCVVMKASCLPARGELCGSWFGLSIQLIVKSKMTQCARQGCGYKRTWHASHCCHACEAGGDHGPHCERVPLDVACARQGCGYKRTWHASHCCHACAVNGDHGPHCDRLPLNAPSDAPRTLPTGATVQECFLGERNYLLHLPPAQLEGSTVPCVLVFHGKGSAPEAHVQEWEPLVSRGEVIGVCAQPRGGSNPSYGYCLALFTISLGMYAVRPTFRSRA
jgi:hypothetical protein